MIRLTLKILVQTIEKPSKNVHLNFTQITLRYKLPLLSNNQRARVFSVVELKKNRTQLSLQRLSTQASSAQLSLDCILSGDVGFARFSYLIAVLGHVRYYSY